MAEVTKEEVDGENEVNDPPEWAEDATKGLNNGEKQMESAIKEKSLGLRKSIRGSLKAISKKSPMSPKNKKSENKDNQSSNSPLRPLHSPSKCVTTRRGGKSVVFSVAMASQGQ